MKARRNLMAVAGRGMVVMLTTLTYGCGTTGDGSNGTSTGNPVVAVRFASYNAAASLSTGQTGTVSASSVSLVAMCFKRLRFKRVIDEQQIDENIDLALGEVELDPAGTSLGTFRLPTGTYDRIEFDLKNECGTGASLRVANVNGSFATDEGMTIRFEGLFEAAAARSTLDLAVQQIVSELASVTSSGQLRTKAEGASGTF